jgi:2-phosphosulfolactate phosphatase
MMQILTTEFTKGTEGDPKICGTTPMSDHHLRIHKLPKFVDEQALVGSTVIVIDVLRATSTICTAIANGASEVLPFVDVEDALEAAKSVNRACVVLGGERRGGKIPGFDVGNSPSEYSRKVVAGKRIFITTTNGTRAMHHARLAKRIVIGSFLNLSAVVESVKDESRIDILCAGTDGTETGEDILAAGGIVHRLCQQERAPATGLIQDDAAMAGAQWSLLNSKAQAAGRSPIDQLAIELRGTAGGRNLIGIGLDQDIDDCALIDRFSVVPELDVPNWRITASSSEKPPR